MTANLNGRSGEAARIGEELVALTQRLQQLRGARVADMPSRDDLLSRVLLEIETRSRRRRIFGINILSDPAWDILLDLTHAKLTDTQISVSSTCIASFRPTTTALRCIGKLVDEGHILRREDPADKRRMFVELTDDGFALMTAYFSDRADAFDATDPGISRLTDESTAV